MDLNPSFRRASCAGHHFQYGALPCTVLPNDSDGLASVHAETDVPDGPLFGQRSDRKPKPARKAVKLTAVLDIRLSDVLKDERSRSHSTSTISDDARRKTNIAAESTTTTTSAN